MSKAKSYGCIQSVSLPAIWESELFKQRPSHFPGDDWSFVRCDDDEEAAVGAQLPQQREEQGRVEEVHGVAANNDIECVLERAVGNVFEFQLFARLSGSGAVAKTDA